jgi:uncharacterized membrane protein
MNRDVGYSSTPSESLAVGLGWFSVALGVAELAAPQSVARFIGVAPTDRTLTTLRSFGARELGNGIALLAQPDRAAWVWSRVAGDAVVLAALGNAMGSSETHRGRAAFAAMAVLGVTALDVLCAQQLTADGRAGEHYDGYQPQLGSAAMTARDGRVRVHEAVTINAPIERVEESWASLESMPETLRRLTQVGSSPEERCVVEFRQAPGGRGSEVRVELEYLPRGGPVGRALGRLIGGDPTGQIRQDLRRFKQIVETGDVVVSDGPALWRPAQPATDPREVFNDAGVGV